MKAVVSKISDKGQITLPKCIRDVLSVHSGDLIVYEVSGNIVKMKKQNVDEQTYLKAMESTLEEWQGSQDDDL